jgi:hypothetical protein
MNGRVNKILVWFLSWAVLLLIVIYSPIGSPNLYVHNKYDIHDQGVNFSGGIANAPAAHYYQQYEEQGFAAPVYTTEPKAYTINKGANTTKTIAQTNYEVITPANKSVLSQNISAPDGDFFLVSSRSSAQSKTIILMNGISTINTDLAMTGNPATTRQLTSEGMSDGGTDPGGDPIGSPIPAGNCYWILMFFAIGYAGYKLLIIKHRILMYKN